MQRRFPESQCFGGPRQGETWEMMYMRLSAETSRRLDQFINRSTSKLHAEKKGNYLFFEGIIMIDFLFRFPEAHMVMPI